MKQLMNIFGSRPRETAVIQPKLAANQPTLGSAAEQELISYENKSVNSAPEIRLLQLISQLPMVIQVYFAV